MKTSKSSHQTGKYGLIMKFTQHIECCGVHKHRNILVCDAHNLLLPSAPSSKSINRIINLDTPDMHVISQNQQQLCYVSGAMLRFGWDGENIKEPALSYRRLGRLLARKHL